MIDEVVPVGDLIVDRAAVVTIGDAAIHAARGLIPGRLFRERDHEFLIIANAVGGRRIAPVAPVDFKEARDLAHINPNHAPARRPAKNDNLRVS